MVSKAMCHSFLTQLCGIPFFQLGFCLSGIRKWFTNSMTTFSFFHHISPYTGNLHALAIECSVTCIGSFSTTASKPSKFYANTIEICSSCPWKVKKKLNQPTSLNFCAIWGYASTNSMPSRSSLIIWPLFFGAIPLIWSCKQIW